MRRITLLHPSPSAAMRAFREFKNDFSVFLESEAAYKNKGVKKGSQCLVLVTSPEQQARIDEWKARWRENALLLKEKYYPEIDLTARAYAPPSDTIRGVKDIHISQNSSICSLLWSEAELLTVLMRARESMTRLKTQGPALAAIDALIKSETGRGESYRVHKAGGHDISATLYNHADKWLRKRVTRYGLFIRCYPEDGIIPIRQPTGPSCKTPRADRYHENETLQALDTGDAFDFAIYRESELDSRTRTSVLENTAALALDF